MNVIEVVGAFSENTGNYVIGPPSPSVVSDTLYCNLDSELRVKGLQTTAPGYVPFDGSTATITFPNILPDGQTPDATLLSGTQISATIKADNLSFPEVYKTSNVVTPNNTRTPTFDDTDPAQLAEFNTLKDSIETYETERDTRRASLKTAMLAANFTPEEIAMLILSDSVNQLVANSTSASLLRTNPGRGPFPPFTHFGNSSLNTVACLLPR